MKKILLALAAITMLASCATVKPTERKVYTYFADYRPYAEIGFLITPQSYHGEYESIGEIEIKIVPAYEKKITGYNVLDEAYYTFAYETITFDEITDIAVKEAIKKGADAICNFSITKPNDISYHIKGFCIKRK